MMSHIEEDLPEFVEVVKVKNESDLFEMFVPETKNEHPVCDSINFVVDDYSSIKVKKEFEYIDYDKPNKEEIKVESSYDNFQCKDEVHDEELSEILLIKSETQNQQNGEEFSKNSEADEKIDISEIILQSRPDEDKKFKLESQNDSENQKSFTQRNSPDDDPLKQCKEETNHSTTRGNSIVNKKANIKNCQFCNKSFSRKWFLHDHIVKQHKEEIKGDLKSLITNNKIHTCNICNSYRTTHKPHLDRHINSIHNEVKVKVKCQFCTESFIDKRSLDGHVLRKHKDNIKNDIKSFITNKIHVCKICDSFETLHKSNLDQHINSVHNEVKIKMKCQFCTESFIDRRSLDEHILRKHKDKIKNDIKRFITRKIHMCKICNSYQTTKKSTLDQHINSVHNEVKIKMKCNFCTKSFILKNSLDGHVLREHKEKIKNNIKSFITSKIHVCKICNSYETTHKSHLDQHMKSAHNKVKIK